MKAHALYHLLQLRARKLRDHINPQAQSNLIMIQESLMIKRELGCYYINWTIHGIEKNLCIVGEEFKFYEKGDSDKVKAKRPEKLNHRLHNWNAALELWRKIFSTSDLVATVLFDNGELSFGRVVTTKSKNSFIENGVLASVLALMGFLFFSLSAGIQLGFAALALLWFVAGFSMVHLRQPVHVLEKIIVISGLVIPIYLNVQLAGITLVLFALALSVHAERVDKIQRIAYLTTGILFGLGAFFMQVLPVIVFVVFSVLLALTSVIDNERIQRLNIVLMILGFGIAVLITSPLAQPSFTMATNRQIPADMQIASTLSIGIAILTLFSFSCWWIVGIQYYLSPWLALFAIFVAAVSVWGWEFQSDRYALTCLIGFTLFVIGRVFSGFINKK